MAKSKKKAQRQPKGDKYASKAVDAQQKRKDLDRRWAQRQDELDKQQKPTPAPSTERQGYQKIGTKGGRSPRYTKPVKQGETNHADFGLTA